ncbi:hypothetical protein GH733_015225 [Mirounga leonina]|nr:hypothetical protein GH733_015225 [Mirounga leonina]
MICKLRFEVRENCDINGTITQRGEVCWKTITDCVTDTESAQNLDYGGKHEAAAPCGQFEIQYTPWLQWTAFAELFPEISDVLEKIPPNYCSVMILLTAGLGQLLKSYLQQTKFALACRPFRVLTNLEDLALFPAVTSEVLTVLEVMKKYTVILKVMFLC